MPFTTMIFRQSLLILPNNNHVPCLVYTSPSTAGLAIGYSSSWIAPSLHPGRASFAGKAFELAFYFQCARGGFFDAYEGRDGCEMMA